MSNIKSWRVFLFLLVLLFSQLAAAAAEQQVEKPKPFPAISNLSQLVKDLHLAQFKDKPAPRKIKIAVLGNGFFGHEVQIGKTLPADIQYHPGPASKADEDVAKSMDSHDLMLAKVVVDLIKASGAKGEYELHLFLANGLTKFEAAVDSVVKDRFDLVLYSQVWQWGGNGDGQGFINAIINKAVATAPGIIWINASGDFGKKLTRIVKIDSGDDNWVRFKDKDGNAQDNAKILCTAPKGQKCGMRLMVAWNDFSNDKGVGTNKDLDIYFLNSKQKEIASSKRIQLLKRDTEKTLSTIYPREEIAVQNIAPGTYHLKVENKSKNFNAEKDQLRITISGVGFELDQPTADETLLPPADNDNVIAIGASDDDYTSRSVSRGIPEVYLRSATKHKDGSFLFSTSNAAGLAAAVSALHLMTGTEAKREIVLAKLKEITRKPDQDVIKVEGNVSMAPRSLRGPRRTPGQENRAPVQRQYSPQYEDESYWPQDELWEDGYGDDGMIGMGMGVPQQPVGVGGVAVGVAPPPAVRRVPVAPLPVMYEYAVFVLQNGGRAGRDQFGRPVIFINLAMGDALGLVTRVPCQRGFVTPQGSQFFYENQLGADLPPTYYEVIPVPRPLPPGSCGNW